MASAGGSCLPPFSATWHPAMPNFWKTLVQTFSDAGMTNPPGASSLLLPPFQTPLHDVIIPASPSRARPIIQAVTQGEFLGQVLYCPLKIVYYRLCILGCSHPSPIFLRVSVFEAPRPELPVSSRRLLGSRLLCSISRPHF